MPAEPSTTLFPYMEMGKPCQLWKVFQLVRAVCVCVCVCVYVNLLDLMQIQHPLIKT